MSYWKFLIGAVLCAVVSFGSPVPSVAAAPPKSKPNAFKVQLRHTGWSKAATPNPNAAKAMAHSLRATGWTSIQIRQPRPGVFVVRAKMPRWQTRAIVANPAVAHTLAAQGRAQGFQARVVPVHL